MVTRSPTLWGIRPRLMPGSDGFSFLVDSHEPLHRCPGHLCFVDVGLLRAALASSTTRIFASAVWHHFFLGLLESMTGQQGEAVSGNDRIILFNAANLPVNKIVVPMKPERFIRRLEVIARDSQAA